MKTTIEMAREAAGDDWGLFQEYMPEIHRLAELVRADERARMAEQPAQQEPDRVKFERHWRKIRGEKKAKRELPRHPLQPQTYIQDSANRHWVTWQAAVMSVAPPAQRKPLTDEEILTYRHMIDWTAEWSYINFARAIEQAHDITGEQK